MSMRLSAMPPPTTPLKALDAGQILEDALHLAQELTPLVEQTPMRALETGPPELALLEPLQLGPQRGQPRLENGLLTVEPRRRVAKRHDQEDGTLNLGFEDSQTGVEVVRHPALPAVAPRTSAPRAARR